MNRIESILIAIVFIIILWFVPEEAVAKETYQQQNFWYKADEEQNINEALDKTGMVCAARVDNGNAYMGKLADAFGMISIRSSAKNYLVGTDRCGKAWYFCNEAGYAKWVHPVDYRVSTIEYPDILKYEGKSFKVIHIGGAGSSYKESDYKKDKEDYVLRVSANNCKMRLFEDNSSLKVSGTSYRYNSDSTEVEIYTGSFGNGYIYSNAEAYRSGNSFENIKTVEVNTRYVNNTLKKVIIPETVVEIAPYTFYLCNFLSEIYGCKGVQKYGEYCFAKEYTAEISSFGADTYMHSYEDDYAVAGGNTAALVTAAREFEAKYIDAIDFPECDFVVGDYVFMGAGLYGEIELRNCTALGKGALKDNVDVTLLRLKKLKKVKEESIEGCAVLKIEYIKDEAVYRVNHYLQDADGTRYELYKTEQFVGIIDSVYIPQTYCFEGFLVPQKRSIKISASGTSQINYYYDRETAMLEVFGNEGVLKVTGGGNYLYGSVVKVIGSVEEGWRATGWKICEGEKTVWLECEDGITEVSVEIHAEDISAELMAEPLNTVPYQVRYYFMDETGTYNLDFTEQCYGTTGSEAEVKSDFEGFVLVEFSNALIKGNGSTIIELYFDRAESSTDEEQQTDEIDATDREETCLNGHAWYRGSIPECPFCESYIRHEDYRIVEYEAEILERLYINECDG